MSIDDTKDTSEHEQGVNEKPDTLADAIKNARQNQSKFHASENDNDAPIDEDGSLPSVNRRKSNNNLITVLGFIFILGIAAFLIITVNQDNDAPVAKSIRPEQIANTLPPLIIPPAPKPIAYTAPTNTQPQAGAVTKNGQPIKDWTDRKMMGALLISTQSNTPANDTARPVKMNDAGNPALLSGESSQSQNENNELAAQLEPTITKGAAASFLPDRNFLITKGTSLDCALETALDSTIPGLATCRLTRNVYSDNGQVLLLDRGSQLVGEYQGGIKQGQVRLFVLWTRAKTPKGVIISLNSPGVDALGRSGLKGWVDNHFAERFGAAILMSIIKDSLAIIANRSVPSDGGTTNIYGGASTGGEKVVEKILESTVNIPPTIIKNQGDHIQVMIARDLDFSDVYSLAMKQ